jgi:hypothetical protein
MVFGDLLHELLVLVGALNRLAASGRHRAHAVLPTPCYTSLSRDKLVFRYPNTSAAERPTLWKVERMAQQQSNQRSRDSHMHSPKSTFPSRRRARICTNLAEGAAGP